MEGIVIVIAKSMACDTNSWGGYNIYHNGSGFVIGELDLYNNQIYQNNGDIGTTSISLKECMIGNCSWVENGTTEQKLITSSVSINNYKLFKELFLYSWKNFNFSQIGI
jgi:hypothetical protein